MIKSLYLKAKAKLGALASKSKVIKYSPLAALLVTGAASAETPATTTIITKAMIDPIAAAITSTVGVIVPVAMGVLATVLAVKVGMGLVKNLITKAT